MKEYYKQSHQKHKEKRNKSSKEYRQKNKKYFETYRKENKAHMKEYCKEYCKKPENKKRRSEYNKKYYQEHKERILKRQNKHHQKPEVKVRRKEYGKKYGIEYNQKPEVKKRCKEYRKKSENKIRGEYTLKKWKEQNPDYNNKYNKERRKTDKNFNIIERLRGRVRLILNKYLQTGKIMSSKKYGIDYESIINHLKPFPEDTSRYHIDHIKPLCSFNFINKDGSTNLEEVKKAFAPENHQWLTIHENMSKGGRY